MSAMRIGLLPVILAALTALPGCLYVPKPPRPTLTGPDTGWTNTPTTFTVTFTHQSGNWMTQANFEWGDSSMTSSPSPNEPITHAYTVPGVYLAKCMLVNEYVDEYETVTKGGDWSKPCTVHIVPAR